MSDQYPDELRIRRVDRWPSTPLWQALEYFSPEDGEPYIRQSIHDNIMSGIRAQMRAEIKATAEHHNALNEANVAAADRRIAELEAENERLRTEIEALEDEARWTSLTPGEREQAIKVNL